MKESYYVWKSHINYEWVMWHRNESCHIGMSHVTYESHVAYAWFMSHTNEFTYEWVMSHMNVLEEALTQGQHEILNSTKRFSECWVHYKQQRRSWRWEFSRQDVLLCAMQIGRVFSSRPHPSQGHLANGQCEYTLCSSVFCCCFRSLAPTAFSAWCFRATPLPPHISGFMSGSYARLMRLHWILLD